MQIIPLQQIPNQAFSVTLDSSQWNFVLKNTNGAMAASITLNNNIVIENLHVVANQLIIPSIYQEAGNFLFLTQSFMLPDYTQFGITQLLVYITAAELATFRQAPTLPITVADFNSIAALPLRFSPQGYVAA